MRMITVSVFKREHLVLLGVSDPDFFKDCFGVRMDVPDLSDPFNWSGLPYHIKQKVVSDFRATQEDQFVYRVFPDYPVSSHRQEMFEQYTLRRNMIEGMGLPSHLVSAGKRTATLRIPKMNNEVRYNGVLLSQLEIPVELEPTRKLVIEFINEIAVADYPNLLTLFVGRGGNIHDLTEFFSLVKVAVEKEQILENYHKLRQPMIRSREDERGHEQYLRDTVRGIFQNNLCPEIYNPTPISDRDHTKLAIKATPEQIEEYAKDSGLKTIYKDGEFLPRVTGAYAVGTDGVKRDLRDIDFLSVLLGAVEGEFFDGNVERELQKTGVYRPQGGIDVFKVAALAKRNTTVEGELVDKGVEVRVIPDDELPPESTVKIQNATLSGMTLPRRPNPLREHWEKHGDPYEGRIPHIAAFSELAKLTSQSGRNETMAIHIEPVLTPEEIVDREQAIQEASAGKLDYLLEGTQWDPKNRK